MHIFFRTPVFGSLSFSKRGEAACRPVHVVRSDVSFTTVEFLGRELQLTLYRFGVAFVVYLVGGIVYQRAVMHQRGWRQLPNYNLWAGIASFVKDMVIVMFYSVTRCCTRRKGFNQVKPPNGHASGLREPPEDENRIIDQLDEEWDD